MAIFPEDELDNINPSDDLFPDGDSIFAVPLVRMEGLADEMTDGMLINPKFIPTMLDRIDLEGVLPVIVTEVADQGYLVSLDLTDFILNSNPVVPSTPISGDCSTLIASTEFVCQAIADACKVLGPDPEDENRFLFEDCDSNPFVITVYPNPTLVEGPDNVFTWTDPGTLVSVVLDLRPNTFNIEADGTHVWTNPVTGQVHSINAGNLGIDPVGLSHITATNVRSAIAELNDLVITMTPDTEGGLTLANSTESFKVLLACEGQRVTDIVPAGSRVFICTPNDGAYITDIDNILPTSDEIDCDLIANTDIVPADTKVIVCTPNDGVKKTDLAALLSDCNFEVEEGEGIDVDVQDGTGLCGGTKHYKISVDLCEFTITNAADVSVSTAPYFAMCVDGANFKISLNELQLLLDAVAGGDGNFWTQGQGTSLVGLGTVGSPYSVDLALQDYTPIPYEPTASIAQISFGNNGIMPAIKAGTNIIIDPDGTLHSSGTLSTLEWGNILGDITAQTDLQDEFVNVTGDSMTGPLGLENTALILRTDGAVDVGYIKAIETETGYQWELQILGSSDGIISDMGMKLDGDYVDLDSTTIAMNIPGAEIGARLVATGIRANGSAVLGFEPAPAPTYSESCSNASDFLIGTGAGPQAWVDVCIITTTEDITDEIVAAYFQIFVVNTSTKTGKVEVSSYVDAGSPSNIHSFDIPANFKGTISDVVGAFPNTTSGQTITFVVRANGDNVPFSLNAVGTTEAAQLKFVVLGSGGGAPVAHSHELVDITDSGEMAAVDDAPADGEPYGRLDNTWTVLFNTTPALLQEATPNINLSKVGEYWVVPSSRQEFVAYDDGSDGSSTLTQTIDYVGIAPNMLTATAVSGDGLVLAIANYALNGGEVRFYDNIGSTWVERAGVFLNEPGATYGEFGGALELNSDGTRLFVSTRTGSWSASPTVIGFIYIFDWNGSAWVDTGLTLPAPTGDGNPIFTLNNYGKYMAISGDDTVLVVYGYVQGDNDQSWAFFYDWNGTAWIARSLANCIQRVGINNIMSGLTLNTSGSKFVYGVALRDTYGTDRGAVYTHIWDGSAWEAEIVTSPTAGLNDPYHFGSGVDISADGNTLAVGRESAPGAVDILTWSGTNWVFLLRYTHEAEPTWQFGGDVHLIPNSTWGTEIYVYVNPGIGKLLTYQASGIGKYWLPVDYSVSSGNIPAGGTTAQALVKASNSDYDVEWTDQASGGSSAFYGAKLSLIADQARAGTAAEQVLWDEALYDTHNNFEAANNHYRVSDAGYYHISGPINTKTGTPGADMFANILINGASVMVGMNVVIANNNCTVMVDWSGYLVVDDLITTITTSPAGNGTVRSHDAYCYLTIARLGD